MTDDELFEAFVRQVRRRALVEYASWIGLASVPKTVESRGNSFGFDPARAKRDGIGKQVHEAVLRLCYGGNDSATGSQ